MSSILKNPEEQIDLETNFVYILNFEDVFLALKNNYLDDRVELVVLSIPNISKDMYFEFVRASMKNKRTSAVQLHVLYAPEYEEVFSLFS
jgi:hypothetical protein